MSIDVTTQHIGIALAYHLPQSLARNDKQYDNSYTANDEFNVRALGSTTITALPPIPYLSDQPYHPSYTFADNHATRTRCRDVRTIEIANQLAELAAERKAIGLLVRWPGELATTITGDGCEDWYGYDQFHSNVFTREERALLIDSADCRTPTSTREEGTILIDSTKSRVHRNNHKSDGSMGYMRGRILYLLDKCTSSSSSSSSGPLLGETSRPFALFDTSETEQNWIVYDRQHAFTGYMHKLIPTKRHDCFGNSLTEADCFGRRPVFGNEPPLLQKQGKYFYSSTEKYSGYHASSHFGTSSDENYCEDEGAGGNTLRNSFDSFQENEKSRMLKQFSASLSAMHALYDFTAEHLHGRILLPSWVSSSPAPSSSSSSSKQEPVHTNPNAPPVMKSSDVPSNRSTNGSATLVQMPKRKNRGMDRKI
jgi:hypothetical protein